MPGSIHAAMFFNEPDPEGFWLGEDRTEETEDRSCDPVAMGYITAEEMEEIADQLYFEGRVRELQRKWNAFPLRHHAFAPSEDIPDDIPF